MSEDHKPKAIPPYLFHLSWIAILIFASFGVIGPEGGTEDDTAELSNQNEPAETKTNVNSEGEGISH